MMPPSSRIAPIYDLAVLVSGVDETCSTAIDRGGRFKVNPAGTNDRTTRTVVLAHRNNLDAGGEWTPFTDSLTLEATLTPRASLVPRS